MASSSEIIEQSGEFNVFDNDGRLQLAIEYQEQNANKTRPLLKPIVEGMIYPGTIGLITAKPKAGKTNLAFMFAHKLAGGKDYLGFHVQEECCVLMAEFEEGDAVLASRWQRFPDDETFFENGEVGILENEAPFVFVNDGAEAAHVDIDKGLGLQIRLWNEYVRCDRFPDRPGIVFIDTLARAIPDLGGGKYNSDAKYIGAVHDFAEELRIAIVFLHHTNKGEHSDSGDMVNGTNGVAGSADWIMVIDRDNDPDTKQRLRTGHMVFNSRQGNEDELFRWVKLSNRGFWELDTEKEDAEALRKRVEKERSIPNCVKKVASLMRRRSRWGGTAGELVSAIHADVAPNAITKYLNQNQDWLLEQGVRYWNDRVNRKRLLHFEVVSAPIEQAEIICPEPVEIEPSFTEDTETEVPEDYIPTEFIGIENEPFPENYDPDERTVVMNITARVGEAEADEYAAALHTLRDTCATLDDKVKAKVTVSRVHTALGKAGCEVPTHADAVAGRWPKSLIGHIVNGEEV